MDKSPQIEQSIALLVRDIVARRLPEVVELLDQILAGEACLDEDHAFVADLLLTIDRLETLAGNDLRWRTDATRLRSCAENLANEIITAASTARPRLQDSPRGAFGPRYRAPTNGPMTPE